MACINTEFNSQIDATGNITCKRADTFDMEIEFVHEDDSTQYDLSHFDDMIMNVKTDPKTNEYIMQFKLDDDLTVNGAIMTLKKTATEMQIDAATFVYDIQGVEGTTVTTIGGGNFAITPDVTREGDTPTP